MFRIDYSLQSSKFFLLLLVLLHVLALIAVFMASMHFILKIILIFFLILSFYYNGWLLALNKRKKSIIQIIYDDNLNQWILRDRQNNQYCCQLQGHSLVTAFITILNFQLMESRRNMSLILFPDSLSRDEFRRLRVFLLN